MSQDIMPMCESVPRFVPRTFVPNCRSKPWFVTISIGGYMTPLLDMREAFRSMDVNKLTRCCRAYGARTLCL